MFICNSSQPCASECSQAGWLYTGSDNNKYGTVYGYILIYMGVYYSMLYHPKPKVLLSWCGHLPTSSECRILTLHQAAWGVRDGVENDVLGQGRGVSVCRRVEWDGWAWKRGGISDSGAHYILTSHVGMGSHTQASQMCQPYTWHESEKFHRMR